MGQNKIKENNDIKVWLTVNLVVSVLFLIAALSSIAWGTQYLYGALFGLIGVWTSILLTLLHTNFNLKHQVLPKFLGFMASLLKAGIFLMVFLIPLYVINLPSIDTSTVDKTMAFLGPVNLFFIISAYTIPLISSLLSLKFWSK